MSGLDEVVSVLNVFSEPAAIGVNFDTTLIIGDSKKVERVQTYTNLTEVLTDYEIGNPEYKQAKTIFSQAPRASKVMIGQRKTVDGELETNEVAYAAIQAITDDFYGVTLTTRDAIEQLAFADFIEAEKKLFGCSSADENTLADGDTNHLMHKLFSQKYNRSFCDFSPEAGTEFAEAAILGKMLSYPAGSTNWCNRDFAGITPVSLNSTEASIITALNGNRIAALAGKGLLRTGIAAGGRFLDVTHGSDWLNSEVQIALFNLLTSTAKLDFSNSGGLAAIRNVLNGVFGAAVDRNFIQSDYIINIPDEKDISSADKLERALKNVSCIATTVAGINTISSLRINFK